VLKEWDMKTWVGLLWFRGEAIWGAAVNDVMRFAVA
jgi:hypothetical protein